MESRQKRTDKEVASKGHRRDKIENINKNTQTVNGSFTFRNIRDRTHYCYLLNPYALKLAFHRFRPFAREIRIQSFLN